MFDRITLILAAIVGLTIVVFFVIRRLLDRDHARLERRLAFPEGNGEPRNVATVSAASAANLEGRIDRSFDGLVFRTGLGLGSGQVLAMFALTAVALAAVFFFWRGEEWAAALGLVLGLLAPFLFLLALQARRRRLIQSQLPDAFYFMARSLRAGLSLEQTLDRAGEQLEEPLASEFRRCSAQIHLGLHPQRALYNMANRLAIPDFDVFVSTIGLYYQSGGNLALLLDRLAAATRDRIQFLGYFRAATALGRTAAFFLAAAAPILVIAYLVWQPEFASQLFETAAGAQLMVIVAILEIIGVLWFLYLLRAEY